MKVNHYEQVEAKPVEMEGASGCTVRWLQIDFSNKARSP